MRLGLACSFLLMVGCASTSSGVPTLDASSLRAPRLPGVTPRELVVTVDDRRPKTKESAETIHNVRVALNGAFKRSGVKLGQTAPHALALTIEPAEQGIGDLPPEACIQIRGKLSVRELGSTEAFSIGCYEYRHGFGFSMGGGATAAYQGAIEYVLQELDRQLDQVNAPPAQARAQD